MGSEWIITLAVFAPVTAGLIGLLLPKQLAIPRTVLALVGMGLAFVLIASVMTGENGVYQQVFSQEATHTEAAPHAGTTHTETSHAGSDQHVDEAHSKDTQGDKHHDPVHKPVHKPFNPDLATGVLPWVPSLHLNLAYLPDGLGGFFALLVSGIGCLIVLYARGYFGAHTIQARADLYRFYPTLGFFATAMLGVVLADYTLMTLVFWEMTSISSFLLIGWNRYDKHAVKLATQAFFTTGLGGMFLFGGILLLGSETGIWRWSELLANPPAIDGLVPLAVGLMFIGALSKSAQWPLHFWLPGAMAAPTPVSAFLHSATMVKAGVFLIGRMYPIFNDVSFWVPVLAGLGALTMCYGALMAVTKDDLKQIFAYTTVSQLGLLMCMYGLGGVEFEDHHTHQMLPAIDLDITQIANHAFYKAPLFIIAGAIGHLVGTRNLSELKGLFYKTDDHGSGFTNKAMVITILAAGYALAALPGSVSFQAKEMFLYGAWHATKANPIFWAVVALALVTAICNVTVFVRLAQAFLNRAAALKESGNESDDHHDAHHGHGHDDHAHETGPWAHLIWIPGAAIVMMQFVGAMPFIWNTIFEPLETSLNYASFTKGLPWPWYVSFTTAPLYISLLAIGGGLALGVSPFLRRVIIDPHNHIYPATYWSLTHGARAILKVMQSGQLKHYTVMILVAMSAGIGLTLLHDTDALTLQKQVIPNAFEFLPGVLLGLILCGSAIALPFQRDRMVRVIVLGVAGMTTLSLFLIYQAPDLALTQLMVEIISVILFVYVLRMLPDAQIVKNAGTWWRLPVAIMAGLTIGWVTLVAATTDTNNFNPLNATFANLGEWMTAYSYGPPPADDLTGAAQSITRGGGGNNIVNVVLVDMRGFDTMGEICVLGLAAMGVWSLIRGRGRRSMTAQTNVTSTAGGDQPSQQEVDA